MKIRPVAAELFHADGQTDGRTGMAFRHFASAFQKNSSGITYFWNRPPPWLRRLVACLSPRRLGFDPGSVHVGFVVDKVPLGQVFPRVLRFSPVNFIPPVLHYKEKQKKLFIFITGLHNKP
jgi:hypothetical protein